MKKTVVSLITGLIIAGAATSHVSAEEYQVQTGDSLWDIAQKYETTVDHLKDLNNIETDIIQPTQQLDIDKDQTHTVENGDTLIGIAKEYDVNVSELKTWNGIASDLIITGQELKVEGQTAANEDNQTSEEASSDNESEQANESEEQKPQAEPTSTSNNTNDEPKAASEQTSKEITVTSTAYTGDCDGCSGVTSTGIDLNENPDAKVIAVDPDVIPLGTKVYVEGYGEAVAADTGGAVNGKTIDVHVPTKEKAYSWGEKSVNVKILD